MRAVSEKRYQPFITTMEVMVEEPVIITPSGFFLHRSPSIKWSLTHLSHQEEPSELV